MKRILILAFMAIITMGAYAQKQQSIVISTNASLNCEKCITRFKENVPYFKGVKDYTYDATTAKLTISYDVKKTDPETLRNEISMLGYDADNVKADAAAREKLPACCKTTSCGSTASTSKSCSHQCQGAASGEHKCKHASGEQSTSATQHQCQSSCQHKCGQKSEESK